MPEENHSLSPNPKLLLIDGYGFLFRAYHSLPPLTSPDGRPVGAVYGFINMLLKLLADHTYDHMAVVLDAGKKTFRHEIYTAYKANRPEPPEDLIPQFPLVREAVDAFNIPVLDKVGYEADDIIATYAKRAASQGMDVLIVSSDKDLAQLVNQKIKLFDSMKSKFIDEAAVKEKFGVYPDRIADMLALVGDSSDNVPGVPGIGPKTAALLLDEYGDLESLLERAGEIKQTKRRESLQQFQDQARLSRRLVDLDDNVELNIALSELTLKEPDHEHLGMFLAKQGFKTVLHKLEKQGVVIHSNDVAHVSTVHVPEEKIHQCHHTIIRSDNELTTWLNSMNGLDSIAIYILWDKSKTIIKGVGLASKLGKVATVFFDQETTSQDDLFGSPQLSKKGMAILSLFICLQPWFAKASIKWIGCDIKALLRYSYEVENPVNLEAFDDVSLMSYVLKSGSFDHELNAMLGHYLSLTSEEFMLPDLKKVEEEKLHEHLKSCAVILFPLHRALSLALFESKCLTLYERIEKQLITVLRDMEIAGIKVDVSLLTSLSDIFSKEIYQLEQTIYHLAGKEFNIGSPKQLGEILFKDLGLAAGKKSKKSGQYSTNAESLEKLSVDGHEIADHILKWRTYSKLKSTYSDALAKQVQKDGRVHTHYAMTAVNTGRLSSHDPNLQNIPVRTELGNKIREVFIAEKGCKLISADYSQIELRLLAHMADIDILKQAFANDQDIHASTASQIFDVPLDQVNAELRRRAKSINFGIIYGMSSFGLASRLGISKEEAADYIARYFKQYPGIKQYMDRTIEFAKAHGYVQTLMGRKCYIKGIHDKNGAIRQFSERAAINAPLQGSAADIIKMAMNKLHDQLSKAFPKTRMLLQVHDELVLETPEADVEKVKDLVVKTMQQVVALSIPLTVSANAGDNWKQIH